jgi:RHS repeat-associated protein
MPGNWTRLKIALRMIAVGIVLSIGITPLHAQSNTPRPVWDPNEDPAGTAGVLRDQVETGGGYNAHNGNAHRAVTDLEVPGALGAYGLDFTRHWNSTDASLGETGGDGAGPFGYGGWTHSWNWIARHDVDIWMCESENGACMSYRTDTQIIEVSYPDGHTSKFSFPRADGYDINGHYSAEAHGYPWPEQFGGHTTLTDYLRGMDPSGNFFWLHLADGGAVYFVRAGGYYKATRVLDPNGYETTITYETPSSGWSEKPRTARVTGEDGRYLQFEWKNLADSTRVIASVQTGTGQRVEYCYADYTLPGSANLVPGLPEVVQYALTKAKYMDEIDPSTNQPVQAEYTYIGHVARDPHSTGGPDGPLRGMGPLLTVANDPRISGPMTKIQYVFRGGPGGSPMYTLAGDNPQGVSNIDFFHMVAFPIEAELSAETGLLISALGIPPNADPRTHPDVGTRTELRGAGGSRKFYYGSTCGIEPGGTYTSGNNGSGYFTPPEAATGGYRPWELGKITEFSHNPATAHFEFQRHQRHTPGIDGRPWRIFDGRGILTQLAWVPWTGRVSGLWNRGSDESTRLYNWTSAGNSEARDPSRVPNLYDHWLFSQTDERTHTTTYTRDSRRRVTQTTYHDGTWESLTYNEFNDVVTHTLPSGAVKTNTYYPQGHPWCGLLWQEWNSVEGWDERKEYTYDAFDRVLTMQDAMARVHGKEFSVKLTYNARHQVVKEEYPATNGGTNPTKEYRYDRYGNCIEIKNELGFWSTYTYDEYRRCTSYTEPLNAPDWKGTGTVASRTWHWVYDRVLSDNATVRDASTHTSNKWRLQIAPAYDASGNRRLTVRNYDYNDRLSFEMVGAILTPAGGWDFSDGVMQSYTYDANGNKQSFTDPLGRVTDYIHDRRDRLTDTIEPKRADQSARPTMTMSYDPVGNKLSVKFPDQTLQRWELYDPFGQAWRFIDERGNATDLRYQWGPMKKLDFVTTYRARDPASGGGTEPQITNFEYDGLGRLNWTLFPDGVSSELRTYRFGLPEAFKTRKNQTKRLYYDARGREVYHTWDSDAAPRIDRAWDDANRLASITNVFSSIDYGYDAAGQVMWEGNDIAGSGGRTQTNYFRYPSGEVAHLYYPGGTYLRRDYNSRGQLEAAGWDDEENNWWMKLVAYTFLPDGKVDKVDYGNGTTSDLSYDGRGFIGSLQHRTTATGGVFASHSYTRDARDRITSLQKENGRGDRFRYDDEGQLVEGWYNADNPASSGAGATRYDGFSYDALGNRGLSNYVAGRGLTSFVRRDNGLNQYSSWSPSVIYHDDNHPGWSAPGNGVLMADGFVTASYNALNQPRAIWSPTYNGTPNLMWFGYDPLGRCVKRWVGDSGDVYSNPATYLHYDGWNLLQEGNNAWGPARVYVHGNRVDEIVWSNNTFTGDQAFHHYDARGHATLLTDRGGNILERYEYDAFGQPYFFNSTSQPINFSTVGNRFLFTGREWLSDVKLYDYRHRLYQPELGRFLQPDPKQFEGGDYNLYRYCHNDPVNRVDPFGLVDRKIDPEVDKLGVQASKNSLNEAKKDTDGRSQAVQEKDGKLSLGSKFGKGTVTTETRLIGGRMQTVTTLKEEAPVDPGHTPVGVGHVHKDKTGKAEPRFSKADIDTARGSKTQPGIPVYKINESNPSRVIRLTPQVDYRDEPTERVVSP